MTKRHQPPKNHPRSKGTYNLKVEGTTGYLFDEDILSIEEAVLANREVRALGHKSTLYCIVHPQLVMRGEKSTY